MPQFLAIEWDSGECRIAVATLRGRQVEIEHAFAIPRDDGDSPDALGARIAQELDARGCGRPEALVSVGRTRIELRQFTVPPTPDDDLPDVVRFQAAREFNELDDQWRLDFLPIPSSLSAGSAGDTVALKQTGKLVLATAIAPAEIAAIEKVCQLAGLTLKRILLRPCEAAALFSASGGASSPAMRRPQLLIAIFADEVDLTVVSGGNTVFLRTTRFAGARPPVPALNSEIRLTLAAARNQLGAEKSEPVKIESLVLCGREAADAKLAEDIKAELGMPVTLLDPFAGLATATALAGATAGARAAEEWRQVRAHASRFAPLLGMLQAELRGTPHAIDFLNPRRRPPPVSRKKLWYSLGGAAAALLVLYFAIARVEHYWLAAEVDGLNDRVKALDASLEKGKKGRLKTAEVAKWADQETIWLDELWGLSRGLPSAQNVMLSDLTLNTGPRGSQLDLKGWTRKYGTIAEMENGVRTLAGKMNTKDSHEDASVNPYSWFFEATVMVDQGAGKETGKSAGKPPSSAPGAPATGVAP